MNDETDDITSQNVSRNLYLDPLQHILDNTFSRKYQAYDTKYKNKAYRYNCSILRKSVVNYSQVQDALCLP